jgi:hypothetical protein
LNAHLASPPEVSDLIQEVPSLADPTFQDRLLHQSRSPRILDLELSKDLPLTRGEV